ncbi:hypothetical protein DFQ27_004243 [Actinomortierella ambigua]|uniref:Protein kinase domain-containing protein n=1 Tax=Actinomortierella ambigua TaxID=1343610 RepID=A0A9P6Q500_9FUNG|nr:hypothetical protein DFQ27_004243 [Actinomortierella ambigua]
MSSESTSEPRVTLEKEIGSGEFGTVYGGHFGPSKAAIKKFRLSQCPANQGLIDNEIRLLERLRNRHIIQFYGVVRQPDAILLVTDFAELGSLKRLIQKARLVTWVEKKRIAQEIANGLAYIHHEGILHRDLKSANVLLTVHMEVKLCDFGLATVKELSEVQSAGDGGGDGGSGSGSGGGAQGTVRWMAPELLSDPPQYSTKSDIYALGMVMWEMAAMCTTPFKDIDNNLAVVRMVQEGGREQLPDNVPADFRHWVERCWEQDPLKRPDAWGTAVTGATQSIRWSASEVGSFLSGTETMASTMAPKGTKTTSSFVNTVGALSLAPSSTANAKGDQQQIDMTYLSRMAECDVTEAQVYLAAMYESGDGGVEKDEKKAFTWYLRAAELGHSKAMLLVGDMYSTGRGTGYNNVEAAKWYRKACIEESQGATPARRGDGRTLAWFRTVSQRGLAAVGLNTPATSATGRTVAQDNLSVEGHTNSTTMSDHDQDYPNTQGIEESDDEDDTESSEQVDEDPHG